MGTLSYLGIKLYSSADPNADSVFEDKIKVLNVGSQMLSSLLLCGLAEVWLSEHTEEHIVSRGADLSQVTILDH